MPGFMGLRGLEHKNPREMERERRADNRRQAELESHEQRSREKVQEILQDQEGDMSAFQGRRGGMQPDSCGTLCGEKATRIMSSRVAVLSFDDTLLTVQGIFSSVKFRHLPVVDESGRIIGIISDRDFLRMISPFFGTVNEQSRDKELMTRKVGTIMTRNPVCAGPDISVIEAVRIMNRKKISCLPIVRDEEKTLLGIITWKDVVRLFCPAAFHAETESNRLRTGVHINPEKGESVRLQAKAAESARLQDKTAGSARSGAGTTPAPPPSSARPDRPRGDTSHISAPGAPLHFSHDTALRPRSAGQAGSNLADKQRERMSRHLSGGIHPPDESPGEPEN